MSLKNLGLLESLMVAMPLTVALLSIQYFTPELEHIVYGVCLFFIVWLVCIVIFRKKGSKAFVDLQDFQPKDTRFRLCPFCAEEIKIIAEVCRYCRRELKPNRAQLFVLTLLLTLLIANLTEGHLKTLTDQNDIPISMPPLGCLYDMPCKLPAGYPRI